MKISSFDIFDTCLIRKCGTPECFFDVFSLRAFNGEIEEWVRQEFVAARRLTEQSLWDNSYYTLQDIWEAFIWNHPLLKPKEELCRLEQEMEREMLVPVLTMLDKVNECRKKGDKIVFISDMYLPSEFLVDVMRRHGFYQDGDSLYVSCECKAAKYDGALFRYVKDKEGLKSYRRWHHYGDNKQSDYKAPRKLGIKTTLINHAYTPYQQQWVDNDFSLGFKYPSVLAGIGRALHYSTEWTTHTDFVLDVIAPFYCSLVFRMMKDAERHGIKRLYFCARDAYMMFLIAEKYKHLFPSIECVFLYISRAALYKGDDEAKIAYFKSIGLATKEDHVGIIDIRSTGRTLVYLNEYLESKGCNVVRGYYYELFCRAVDVSQEYYPTDYYTELSDRYDIVKERLYGDFSRVFEVLFPLNVLPKTIGYKKTTEGVEPVFETINEDIDVDQVYVEDKQRWADIHSRLMTLFADYYVQSGLFQYSDEVFRLSNNTICRFITMPTMPYLSALQCLHGKRMGTEWIPYVKKESWFRILFTRGKDTLWQEGTLVYSHFYWAQSFYRHFKK